MAHEACAVTIDELPGAVIADDDAGKSDDFWDAGVRSRDKLLYLGVFILQAGFLECFTLATPQQIQHKQGNECSHNYNL